MPLSFPGAGDVWFSLNGTTYQNNSIVRLKDIGEGDNALLCRTNQTACCQELGNWFFPSGTRVSSSGVGWDFYRNRGQMVVCMHRRRGGAEGIYRCEIPDAMNFIQTIYIGVYSARTGEWTQCSVAEEWDSQYQSWWLILWIFLRWSHKVLSQVSTLPFTCIKFLHRLE